MIEKYKQLNDEAKEFIIGELNKVTQDEEVIERCKKEIDILYNRDSLFFIEYLYIYKKDNKNVKYLFRGMENNLLLFYMLGISEVNPIKYNLSYELCTGFSCSVEFINSSYNDFLSYLEVVAPFKIVLGSYEKDNNNSDTFYDNNYLIIPDGYKPTEFTFRINDTGKFETVEDFRKYEFEYIVIKLDDVNNFDSVLKSDFEIKLINLLDPKDFEDYVKIRSLYYGAGIWGKNQDELIKKGIINIKSIISNRDDVYDYLLKHNVSKESAIKITSFIRKGKTPHKAYKEEWLKYKNILNKHNCEKWFIGTCSKVHYLYGRGQVISECMLTKTLSN